MEKPDKQTAGSEASSISSWLLPPSFQETPYPQEYQIEIAESTGN
jgi:hypothetical protein